MLDVNKKHEEFLAHSRKVLHTTTRLLFTRLTIVDSSLADYGKVCYKTSHFIDGTGGTYSFNVIVHVYVTNLSSSSNKKRSIR